MFTVELYAKIRRAVQVEGLGFWSQYLMGRIFFEPFGFDCPDFADEFIGRQALE